MRVIAGRFRSRKLKSVPGLAVRPTPDRLREALFNVLAPHIQGAVFIDAYAGSGAVGIEAVSRGAGRVILIERNAQALQVLRENLRALGIEREATVVRGSAQIVLPAYRADIVFIDPPYDRVEQYAAALLAIAHPEHALCIAQHPAQLALEEKYGDLKRFRVLKQGDNSLSFYDASST